MPWDPLPAAPAASFSIIHLFPPPPLLSSSGRSIPLQIFSLPYAEVLLTGESAVGRGRRQLHGEQRLARPLESSFPKKTVVILASPTKRETWRKIAASLPTARHQPRYLMDSHMSPARRGGKARRGRTQRKAGAEGKGGVLGSTAPLRAPRGPSAVGGWGFLGVSSFLPLPPFAGVLGGCVGRQEGTERSQSGSLMYFFLSKK